MISGEKGSAFDNLSELALKLDVKLGVERRKLILAGNEKLTMSTNAQGWTAWMAGVQTRLQGFVGNETAKDLLVQSWMLPETPLLSSDDQS
jgi:hypothetical protein